MSFMDSIKEEQKQYGSGGSSDYFKFEDKGVYKMRLLVQPKVVATHFFGKGNPSVVCVGIGEGCPFHTEDDKKPSIKLATYIIDRNDGKVKMAELPLSISYSLNDLQEDADFAFDEFPMSYDVKVTYDPDNDDPKAKYRLTPSPKQEPLTDEEQTNLNEAMAKKTPEQYVEDKKNNQKKKSVATSTSGTDYPGAGYPETDEDIASSIPF
jgi:hypothetical protein